MNRTKFALVMGIAFVPLVVSGDPVETQADANTGSETPVLAANGSASAPETDEHSKAGSESPVLDANSGAIAPETDENAVSSIDSLDLDATTADSEQDATSAPEIDWDPQTGTLTARIDWASIDQVVHALEGAGVEVTTHASWAQVRISASFEDLPLQEAAERLFGKTFLLVWPREAAGQAEASGGAGTKGPLIRLLSIVDAEAIAGEASPYDAATLDSLVESGAWEEAVPALEAALIDGDDQLRGAALELIQRNPSGVDRDILRAIAQEDANPELRQQALTAIGRRISEPEASRDALTDALQNDPDANVRAAAEAALSNLQRQAEYLYKRDLRAGQESQDAPGSQRPPLPEPTGLMYEYGPLDNPSGLYDIAHGDGSPERRQEALAAIGRRVHEPDASWDALTHALQNDPDPNVRATAEAVMADLYRRAKYLYKRNLYQQ